MIRYFLTTHGRSWVFSGTFLLFISMMMAGTLIATTLVDPSTVKRADGSSVVIKAEPDWV